MYLSLWIDILPWHGHTELMIKVDLCAMQCSGQYGNTEQQPLATGLRSVTLPDEHRSMSSVFELVRAI